MNDIELRSYYAANAPRELKDLFHVKYKMSVECPPDIIGKYGSEIRFVSIEAAYKHGLEEWQIVNHNESVINEWKEEKFRIEEVLWRYNYADYMIEYGKKDLTSIKNNTLLKL